MRAEGHVKATVLDDAPDPLMPSDAAERFYWNAFCQLSSGRNSGMDLGPIPPSEVLAYCDLYSIQDLDERDVLIRVVQRADSAFLEAVRAKRSRG